MESANGVDFSSAMLAFHIQHETSRLAPRVGTLRLPARPAIATPSLVAATSRGVIPHVTPDLVQRHTAICVTYAGLEDFLEKSRQNAPIFNTPSEPIGHGSVLRKYTGLPDRCLSILGPRRIPRLKTPNQNANSALAISTSFGFARLELEEYNTATWKLTPDIATAAVDLVDADSISKSRIEKCADRTHAWLRDTVDEVQKHGTSRPLFASIPPLESQQQSFYLSDLANEFEQYLSGICIYEPTTINVVPPNLNRFPILCLSDPSGPHDLLRAISIGVDLISTPFITATSEAGIALTFEFKPPSNARNEPLGIDMWSSSNTTDLSSLSLSCQCYACTRHHRAYVYHLLQAKEMLAWTLLQIHNFHVVNQFLKDVRQSIIQKTFEEDHKTFRMAYEEDLPQKTGQGPRVRGYQLKSIGRGEPKMNPKAYNKLEEQARKLEEAQAGIAAPGPGDNVQILESQGLGQKSE